MEGWASLTSATGEVLIEEMIPLKPAAADSDDEGELMGLEPTVKEGVLYKVSKETVCSFNILSGTD